MPVPRFVDLSSINAEADSAGTDLMYSSNSRTSFSRAERSLHPPQLEASSGSPVAHISERMIADALIEAGLVTACGT